jgi:hypothetical protein
MWHSMARQLAQLMTRRSNVPRTNTRGDNEANRPVLLLGTQEAQQAHELALSQPEVALAQLTGSIELDASRE